MRAAFVLIVFLSSIGADCGHSGPAPAPSPPIPPAAIYEEACANLAGLGCSEGVDASCAATMQATDGKVVDIKAACLAAAKTVGDVRACGTVECVEAPSSKIPATCAVACANVRRFGCPEGPSCLATCGATQGKVVDLRLACLAKAKTKQALVACGTIACK